MNSKRFDLKVVWNTATDWLSTLIASIDRLD